MTPSSFPKYEISNKPRTVYFADPYSGWQRGTNDHFSGRIRKYPPKGTSFENLTQVKLNEFINEINNWRRNVLGWATPAAVFQELCSK
jgi:IS30 family transposase